MSGHPCPLSAVSLGTQWARNGRTEEATRARAVKRLTTSLKRRGPSAFGSLRVVVDRFGQDQTHPLVVEARQSSIALARLVAALRLPDDAVDGEEAKRPQRRGIRGVYSGAGARGGVSACTSR